MVAGMDAGQGIVRAGRPVDPPRLSSATPQGRGIGVAFLLALPPSRWLLLFTPGILPSALRAGFAVRTRSCACVATQREVIRSSADERKPAAGEQLGDIATIEA